MNIAILTALVAGGTIVRIPLEGNGDPVKLQVSVLELELEAYSCCGKDYTKEWRYDACVHCGKEMKPERQQRCFRARIEDGALEVISGGDFKRLVLLRLSDLERCIDAAGYRVKRTEFLRGSFALHVEDAEKAVAKIRTLDGVTSAEAKGGVIYVQASKVAFKDLGNVGDVSWVINLCQGYAGFAK